MEGGRDAAANGGREGDERAASAAANGEREGGKQAAKWRHKRKRGGQVHMPLH